MDSSTGAWWQVWRLVSTLIVTLSTIQTTHAQDKADLDLKPITEKHVMIPMRDGKRLSAYLYSPPGKGPWPVVFEQRYADLRGAATRKGAAKLAHEGFVVALVNFRGTHQSEGTWVGYRALGWGKLKDGYDTCEWLAAQSCSLRSSSYSVLSSRVPSNTGRSRSLRLAGSSAAMSV